MESRKAGRKCTMDLKASKEKVAKLEELSEERVEFFFATVGEYRLDERDGSRGKCQVHGIIPNSTFCSTKQSIAQLAGRSMRPLSWLLKELLLEAVV